MDDLNGKKILVTGGAGFIGYNLVKRLIREGADVTVLDDMFTGRPEFIITPFVKGSVTDYQLVKELVRDTEIIFHLAGRNIRSCSRRELLDVNWSGTTHVLNAAERYGKKKVVYAGSASVYGNCTNFPIQENTLIQENKLDAYALSKIQGELVCKHYYRYFNLPVIVLRYSNVYGPGQSPSNPYCGVVARFFEAKIKDRLPIIYGDGTQTRDFVYIDDAIEATIVATLSDNTIGAIFNVATGRETSINELAKIITDKKPEYTDKREHDIVHRRVLDVSKIKNALGWEPKISLEEGLKKTYQWLKGK